VGHACPLNAGIEQPCVELGLELAGEVNEQLADVQTF
jgi:hypothetical protein